MYLTLLNQFRSSELIEIMSILMLIIDGGNSASLQALLYLNDAWKTLHA